MPGLLNLGRDSAPLLQLINYLCLSELGGVTGKSNQLLESSMIHGYGCVVEPAYAGKIKKGAMELTEC